MERIKEAINKARLSRHMLAQNMQPAANGEAGLAATRSATSPLPHLPAGGAPVWQPPVVRLNPAHLERNRIVSYMKEDVSHVAFDILRTRVQQTLAEHQWTTIAVTSPTSGCGKTMVACNMAISMARQAGFRVVLIDLDLRRPAVAKTLGVPVRQSLGQYVEGTARLEDCFVSISDDLFVGLNTHPIKNPTEMIQQDVIKDILPQIRQGLNPDVVIFDLPPMLVSDDVIAFLPQMESGLLVAASGKTTPKELEECERQFEGGAAFLGVVLNKCTDLSQEYYQYSSD